MKKKRIAIYVVLAIVLVASGYLIAASRYVAHDYFRLFVPELNPNEGVGIWESQVDVVGNPGGSKTGILTFLNGKDADRTFYITLQAANPELLARLPFGYEAFPPEYYDWFTLPDEGILVKAGDYCRVQITIQVPYDTAYLQTNAVVKVQGIGFDPNGFAQLGVASIWYITIVPEKTEQGSENTT